MTIVITEDVVSDIFFNMIHDNWNKEFAAADNKRQVDYYEEILPDAKEFAEMSGGHLSPEWIAEDFVNRV